MPVRYGFLNPAAMDGVEVEAQRPRGWLDQALAGVDVASYLRRMQSQSRNLGAIHPSLRAAKGAVKPASTFSIEDVDMPTPPKRGAAPKKRTK